MLTRRDWATKYAWSFIGVPYHWGGDDPMEGFDCSGFCIEILRSVGVLSRFGDWTAHDLWVHFQGSRTSQPDEGCLVYWWGNSNSRIVHIEYCLNDKYSLGASGGGSSTTNMESAIRSNAYIKMRPFMYRSGVAGFTDPFNE
jgi:cell wall-associated NlpC family hydrolase